MNLIPFQFLHVISAVLLFGFVIYACAAPKPENRRWLLMVTGIFALLALLFALHLVFAMKYGFTGWVIVKLVGWLALAALPGLAFRKPSRGPKLAWVAAGLAALAVAMVYFKPF
jgi:hypothetical protein